MRLTATVYDPTGTIKLGSVTTLENASMTRKLDAAGTWKGSFPPEENALALFQPRRFVVLTYQRDEEIPRELGRGVIGEDSVSVNASRTACSAGGSDQLEFLMRRTVKSNRQYTAASVGSIAQDLVSIVPGWSAVIASDVSGLTSSARFDAATVMKAVVRLVEENDIHLRPGVNPSTVEFGHFGSFNGIYAVGGMGSVPVEMSGNDQVVLIKTISRTRSSKGSDFFNRLYIFGAGQNIDAALTLEKSTRGAPTYPYAIQNVTENGRKLYYIEDAASVAAYGVVEAFGQYKEIAPLSTTSGDVINAANALYDAGVRDLRLHKDVVEAFKLSFAKAMTTIRPGDKLQVVYKGYAEMLDSHQLVWLNVNAPMWVMSVTENVGADGLTTDVEVATLDRLAQTEKSFIAGSLETLMVNGVKVQPSFNHYPYGPEQREIDASNNAKVQLIISDACYKLDRVLVRVRTQPFTSTAKSAAHRHMVGQYVGATTIVNGSIGSIHNYSSAGDGSGPSVAQTTQNNGSTGDLYTFSAAGAQQYGIYKDVVRPDHLTITVNDVDVTNAAAGNADGSSDLDTTIDITAPVRDRPGGFQGVHDVLISCAGGQGELVISFDVYEEILPFRYTA